MKSSPDLWELVHSLTAHEKRYFKVHSSQHGGSQKYLLIFDAIDAQGEYDEVGLKERFREEKFVRQFSVAKRYLYDLILRTLRSYHEGSTVTARLREVLANVEILNDKGLTTQALKILEKGIALAEEHERYLFLIQASLWQVVLRPSLTSTSEQTARYLADQNELVDRLVSTLDYRGLLRQVSVLLADDYTRSPEDLERLERLAESPLLRDHRGPRTFHEELFTCWIEATLSYGRNDYAAALQQTRQMVQLFEAHPHRRREESGQYLLSLGNTLALQRRCHDVDGFFETIRTLEAFRSELETGRQLRSPRIAAELFQTSSLYRLAFHIGRNEFSACVDLIPEIERGLKTYGEYLKPHMRHKFFGNLCYVSFAEGDLDRAIDYNNRIVNDPMPVEGRQTYFSSHLVALLLFYERGEIRLVEHRVESTRRFLATHQQIGPLEEALLDGFRQLLRAGDPATERSVLLEFRARLGEVAADPLAQNGLRYFGYQPWIESRLAGSQPRTF